MTATATLTRDRRSWPLDRRTEEVIAERMLAAALYNDHLMQTQPTYGPGAGLADFKGWDALPDAVQAELVEDIIPQVRQLMWRQR